MESFCIQVWPFDEGPEHYRLLSNNGGDEDWIVFIPESFSHVLEYGLPLWLEKIDTGYSPQVIKVHNGTVFIGSHA